MTPQTGLFLSATAFVGTHFLMSHPLRTPMVSQMGTKAFRGIYTAVSLITFGAMIYFYREIVPEPPIFAVGEWAWAVGAILMWLASVLLVGSFFGNPALPGAKPGSSPPAGVLRITRHPMMWSFALWAAVHWALIGTAKAMVLDLAIIILALGGAAGQDRKKVRLLGDRWVRWERQTSFLPFGRGLASPGMPAFVGGTLLFLLASWLHPVPVGIWRYFG